MLPSSLINLPPASPRPLRKALLLLLLLPMLMLLLLLLLQPLLPTLRRAVLRHWAVKLALPARHAGPPWATGER